MPDTPRQGSTDEDMPRELPKGISDDRLLPDEAFAALWDAIFVDQALKDRLLGQAILNFTLRARIKPGALPFHGIILLVGPPGTGKTSLARGLASRTASAIRGLGRFRFLEIEPHGLGSSALGRSQQAVSHLLGSVIPERASEGPLILLLDEVESLATDRWKMSLEANPIDVHRATDAVLTQIDRLAVSHPRILFVATSNFSKAIDEAFLSRVDVVERVDIPTADGCEKILRHTLEVLAQAYPPLQTLAKDPDLDKAVKRCVGLDGRRIRKVVLSACGQRKEIALDPSRLTVSEILAALERTRAELGLI